MQSKTDFSELYSTLIKRIYLNEKKGNYEIYLRNFSSEGSEDCVISGVSAERKTFVLKQKK